MAPHLAESRFIATSSREIFAMSRASSLVFSQFILVICLVQHQLGSVPLDGKPKASVQPTTKPTTRAIDDQSTRVVTNENTHPTDSTRAVSTNKRQGKFSKPDFSHLFREQANDYPEDEIKRMLKKTDEKLKAIHNVLISEQDLQLTERIAHFGLSYTAREHLEGESVCPTTKRQIIPRVARLPRTNAEVYIANDQDFMQVIQAEYCQYPDSECDYLSESLPHGKTSICIQKYAYKHLLYMDPLDKRMASDRFPYPSCCSCHVKTSYDFDLRTSVNKSALASSFTSAQRDPLSSAITIVDEDPSTQIGSNQSSIANESRRKLKAQAPNNKPLLSSHNSTVVLGDDKIYSPSRRR